MISISIVSHGQKSFVLDLLSDINKYCCNELLEVLLTVNVADENFDDLPTFFFPIRLIKNISPYGFGENHNRAFEVSSGSFFCVLNPDIRLSENPFHNLIKTLEDKSVGVSAPIVLDSFGNLEDSARRFPSPFLILCKVLGFKISYKYPIGLLYASPDWVAGMFMLFRSEMYASINGFDERYFLYYEDVDICARLTNAGMQVALCTNSKVVHLAQRTSHRNFKYLRWHLTSMLRFFMSRAYWRLVWR
jgi:N-acetylglucosaminyl-diphospho-decaprenol L-rhamnosyltransferase